MALAIIDTVSHSLGLQLSKTKLLDMAKSMRKEFPVSTRFYRWISHEIVYKNIDMQSKTSKAKRWNWLWDYHVSFVITQYQLDERDVILVTSDNDIKQIIINCDLNNRVLTLSQYLCFLNS